MVLAVVRPVIVFSLESEKPYFSLSLQAFSGFPLSTEASVVYISIPLRRRGGSIVPLCPQPRVYTHLLAQNVFRGTYIRSTLWQSPIPGPAQMDVLDKVGGCNK